MIRGLTARHVLVCLLFGGSAWAGEAPGPVTISFPSQTVLDPDGQLKLKLAVANLTGQVQSSQIDFAFQQEPALYSVPAPLPLHGIDVALGKKSWGVLGDGRVRIESDDWHVRTGQPSYGAMTDGKPWTNFGADYGKDIVEAIGFIDLGQPYPIEHMIYEPSDPALTRKVDFSFSMDGATYTPDDELKGIALSPNNPTPITLSRPVTARFIRLRLNNDNGDKKMSSYRYPREFHVYAGITADTWTFPNVGRTIQSGSATSQLDAHGSVTLDIGDGRTLGPGAYFVAVRTKTGDVTQMTYGHIFVMPPKLEAANDRNGIDADSSDAVDLIGKLGDTSVHYEKLSWSDVSPTPDIFDFRAQDTVLKAFHDAKLPVVAPLHRPPEYLVAPPMDKRDPRLNFFNIDPRYTPLTDFSKYADFVFQTAARYGSKKHEEGALQSKDKVSGLGYIDTLEMWDEPNARHNYQTKWKGTFANYYKLLRLGAEAAKKADPDIKVANGGFFGIEESVVDTLRTFKYEDGKTPLDFIDVLSAHYFAPLGDVGSSHGIEPELTTVYDISHHHDGFFYERSYEDDLRTLVAWRDKNKPQLPIWLTAVAFDQNTNERFQSCWLPRGVMMALASGVDRVQLARDISGGSFGIVRDKTLTLKPAWFSYATLLRQLDGVDKHAVRIPSDDPNVRIYLWNKGGKPVLTAWTIKENTTGIINLSLGKCTVTDTFGGSSSEDVAANFPLTEFPVYISDISSDAAAPIAAKGAAWEKGQQAKVDDLSQRRAYLFKFGRGEDKRLLGNDAVVQIGTIRNLTLVSGKELYDDVKGYGFTPVANDQQAIWAESPLTIDAIKFLGKGSFKFKAQPGEYNLRIFARSKGPITIGGLDGPDQPVTTGVVFETKIKVGDKPVTISGEGGGELIWLVVMQDDGAKK